MNAESTPQLSDRITALEELFTHLQRTVADLDQVIIEQQKTIDVLRLEIERQALTISQLSSALTEPRTIEDDKPPHY